MNCKNCGIPAGGKRSSRLYCSDKCRVESWLKLKREHPEINVKTREINVNSAALNVNVEQEKRFQDLKHKCMNEHLDIEEVLEVMKYWFARLSETTTWTVPDWINALFIKTGKKIVVASTNSEGFPTDFAIEALTHD